MNTSTNNDDLWLDELAKIDAEELGERMDDDPEFEDTNVEDSFGR